MSNQQLRIFDYIRAAMGSALNAKGSSIKPLHTVANTGNTKEGRDKLLGWVKETFGSLSEDFQDYHTSQIRNLMLRKGIHYYTQDFNADFRYSDGTLKADSESIVANYIEELGKQRKSKLLSFIPATRAIPNGNDYVTQQKAKTADKLLDSIKYQNNYKKLIGEAADNAYIFGEQPILVLQNPYKGKLKSSWEKFARELERKSPSATEGRVTIGEVTKEINLNKPEYEGGLEFRLHPPYMTMYDPKSREEDCQWALYWTYEHIEDVMFDHRDLGLKREDLLLERTPLQFNPENMEVEQLVDHVMVMRFYARSSRRLRDGLYFKCTDKLFLTPPEDNQYEQLDRSPWGNIPHEVMRDLKFPGHLRGYSTINLLKGLQNKSNKFLSDIGRNLELTTHPKALVPNDSGVKVESLVSQKSTIIRYNYPFKPEIVSFDNFSPGLVQAYELYKQEFFSLGGSGPVSQGDIPRGLRSGVALRLVKQFEDIRNADLIQTVEDTIVNVDRRILPIVQKHYPEKLMVSIIGKDKQRQVAFFKKADLSSVYDIEIQTVNPVFKDPAGLTQSVYDLVEVTSQTKEGVPYTNAQLLKILDYPTPDAFRDPAIAAIDTAEFENSMFAEGKDPGLPMRGEDCLTHILTHLPFYREPKFREMPQENQDIFTDHMRATEFLTQMAMAASPIYEQYVYSKLPDFPYFSENYLFLLRSSLPGALPQAGLLPQEGSPNAGQLTSIGAAPSSGAAIMQAGQEQ